MSTNQVIIIARKHLGGEMESSARLCLYDAVRLYDAGDHEAARIRALKSIAYSVGMGHADYLRASN